MRRGDKTMSLKGQIRDLELIEVLLSIGKGRSTGILTVQGEQEIVGISFLEGEVVSADALNRSLEEGLGEVLVERSLVQLADFQALTTEHHAGGDRVPDLLLERGFLSRAELLDALRTHTTRLCLEVLSWRAGEYKFYAGDEVSFEEGFEPIPVETLLVATAKELGPEGPLSGALPPPGAVFRRVPPSEQIAVEPIDESEPVSGLSKPGLEADLLLELVDGARTVSDLVDETGLAESKVLLSLHQLRTSGRIQPVSEDGSSLAGEPLEVPVLGDDDQGEVQEKAEPETAGLSRIAAYLERRRTQASNLAVWPIWLSRSMGALLAVTVIVLWSLGPSQAIFPVPWLPAARELHLREQWRAAFTRFDRSASMFYLLEGRFPTRRGEFAERGYLGWRDLEGPAGESVLYSASAADYHLEAAAGPEGMPSPEYRRNIQGDFLLDPEFGRSRIAETPALVLVD